MPIEFGGIVLGLLGVVGLLAALAMGVIIYGLSAALESQPRLLVLIVGVPVGGISFFALAALLGMREVRLLLGRFMPSRRRSIVTEA